MGAQRRLELRREAGDLYQLWGAKSQQRSQGHSMDVTRWRRVRRIHVGMSVKVNQSCRFIPLSQSSYNSGKRADGNRMIAANGNRQLAGVHNALDFHGQALAGGVN